ncbi:MAG: hypothetical protein Q4C49_07230 [Bacillota bacterium]|nr:hypothetical protein [Bacillota bacterium]
MEEEKRVLDQWEDESYDLLDSFLEVDNKKNEEIIQNAKVKISKICLEAKYWLENNTNDEKVQDKLNYTKDLLIRILKSTKVTIVEISENEHFREVVKNGKGLVINTFSLLNDGFKAGRKQLEKNESIKAVFDKADEKIEVIKHSDDLRQAVDKVEQAAKKAGDMLFKKVKEFFEEEKGEK